MDIIAKRTDTSFRSAYDSMYDAPVNSIEFESIVLSPELKMAIAIWIDQRPEPKPTRAQAIQYFMGKGLVAAISEAP